MSSLSRWTYTNTATVYPFTGEDQFNGGVTFGAPFTIACTWTAKAELRKDPNGSEFITRNIVWTEDPRPKFRDKIQLAGDSRGYEIRGLVSYDMSPFGEADSPDFELATSQGVL